jgi:hypothetical protein
MQTALTGAGEMLSRHVGRVPEGENVTDAKVLFKVELVPATAIPPRETTTLAIEVSNVKSAMTVLIAQAKETGGRVIDSQVGQERNGRVTARVVVDVPLVAAEAVIEKLNSEREPRVRRTTRNLQAPEGKLALARLDVTMSNELLVPRDEGLWAQVRNGLSFSLRGLSLSVSWLIVGLLFLLPWALVLYLILWLIRRLWRGEAVVVTAPVTPSGGGATSEVGT